jgi:hypothetical protein
MAHQKVTTRKIKNILTERLHLMDPVFFLEKAPDDRIVGDIVSQTFWGKQDDWRQGKIWKALEAELGPTVHDSVGMILAFSRDEWNLVHEDQPGKMLKPKRKAG